MRSASIATSREVARIPQNSDSPCREYRTLLDATKRFIEKAEEYEKALREAKPSATRKAVLSSTGKTLEQAHKDATEVEKLCRDNGKAMTSR
jgi:hypothetical protein